MSVNKSRPHLYIVPEDDANRIIAVGFEGSQLVKNPRQIQIMRVARGWRRALDILVEQYLPLLRDNKNTHVLLALDFDQDLTRYENVFDSDEFNESIRNRVYIVGCRDEPEKLPQNIFNGERLGRALAEDCSEEPIGVWAHEHLVHNSATLIRLHRDISPILFQSNF